MLGWIKGSMDSLAELSLPRAHPDGSSQGASASSQSTAAVAKGWLRGLGMTARLDRDVTRTLPVLINEQALIHADAPALLGESESFTYRELAERSNRYARWTLHQGLGTDDTVCLLMPNRPEYMAIWLGITRVGTTVALLNTNLRGLALAHCINIVKPKHLIVDAELIDVFERAAALVEPSLALWLHGSPATPRAPGQSDTRIDVAIERYSEAELTPAESRPVTLSHRALCIYTSGTTGLPKAANVSHHRVMSWSHWFAGIMDTCDSDRMYNCLPMYHSIGGVVALGSLLVAGGSVLVRKKFTAQRFWDDIVEFDCSLFQYIGELCRYLLRSPMTAGAERHRLRLCCGNGLSEDVWRKFKERFNIPQILEFYASTEGNFSLYNLEGKPGAAGRIPPFLAHSFPMAIVKFDFDKGEPARNSSGRCLKCAPNEVGEAIGRIPVDGSHMVNRFEGYTASADSEAKILRDVFIEGDAWLRTGDLMRQDEMGFFYFVDRIGDTFRWKGENVSTLEVACAISSCPGVLEAAAYGVAVPGTEGKAGMAAIVVEDTFELETLRSHLVERIPDYARPRFLRISNRLEVTETFKQKKQMLVREGFDPNVIDDNLYLDHPERCSYVRLDQGLHDLIKGMRLRL
jgi:fatty-acyl-CoA synthase